MFRSLDDSRNAPTPSLSQRSSTGCSTAEPSPWPWASGSVPSTARYQWGGRSLGCCLSIPSTPATTSGRRGMRRGCSRQRASSASWRAVVLQRWGGAHTAAQRSCSSVHTSSWSSMWRMRVAWKRSSTRGRRRSGPQAQRATGSSRNARASTCASAGTCEASARLSFGAGRSTASGRGRLPDRRARGASVRACALAQHHAAAARGADRDPAPARRLDRAVGRLELEALEHGAQH